MVSGDGHWICTSYSKVDGVNVYEREIQIARVYGETSNTIESILASVHLSLKHQVVVVFFVMYLLKASMERTCGQKAKSMKAFLVSVCTGDSWGGGGGGGLFPTTTSKPVQANSAFHQQCTLV